MFLLVDPRAACAGSAGNGCPWNNTAPPYRTHSSESVSLSEPASKNRYATWWRTWRTPARLTPRRAQWRRQSQLLNLRERKNRKTSKNSTLRFNKMSWGIKNKISTGIIQLGDLCTHIKTTFHSDLIVQKRKARCTYDWYGLPDKAEASLDARIFAAAAGWPQPDHILGAKEQNQHDLLRSTMQKGLPQSTGSETKQQNVHKGRRDVDVDSLSALKAAITAPSIIANLKLLLSITKMCNEIRREQWQVCEAEEEEEERPPIHPPGQMERDNMVDDSSYWDGVNGEVIEAWGRRGIWPVEGVKVYLTPLSHLYRCFYRI